MLELSDFFFSPYCNTQKCDGREIILSYVFFPSLIVVWLHNLKNTFFQKALI